MDCGKAAGWHRLGSGILSGAPALALRGLRTWLSALLLALAMAAMTLGPAWAQSEGEDEAEATDESGEAQDSDSQTAATFNPRGLADDANAYERAVRQRWSATGGKTGTGTSAAILPLPAPGSVAAMEQAVLAADPKVKARVAQAWLALSHAWMVAPGGGTGTAGSTGTAGPDPTRALQAAWLSLGYAEAPEDRVAALMRAADLLEGPLHTPAQALRALQTAQRFGAGAGAGGVGQRISELRRLLGVELVNLAVDPDFPEGPRACLRFSERLSKDRAVHFADFVTVAPAVPVSVQARDDQLCVVGFEFGRAYELTVRPGLPGREAGISLKAALTQTVTIGNRAPTVAFRGDGFILPRGMSGGVPVTTVNLDEVALTLFRLPARNLVPQINADQMLSPLYPYTADQMADRDGERLWQGRMTIANQLNRTVTTSIAVRTLVGDLRPGFYILTAEPVDVPERVRPWQRATQWLMVSDLGLTATRGGDGLNVFVRSLATARPLPGVRVVAVARNNEPLAEAVTDADGRVTIDTSKLSGGRTPMAIMAYYGTPTGAAGDPGAGIADRPSGTGISDRPTGTGIGDRPTAGGAGPDFAMLDLNRAAFDLADRGIGGRKNPGPLDAWLYSERGVYRPGETVQVTTLLRDDRTRAVENFPLTLKVLRPAGTVYFSGVVGTGGGADGGSGAGGHALAVPLSRSAPMGTWTIQAYADPAAEPIGRMTFQVEEFIPERLAVTVAGSAPWLNVGTPFSVNAAARFLYGPPAAGLTGKAQVTLEPDNDPFPDWSGYRFGLVQETMTPRRRELTIPATDADGRSTLGLDLPPLPDTTLALRARVQVEIAEPGGRPTRQQMAVSVRHQPFALGLKTDFSGDRLADGASARVSVIAVGSDGRRVARERVHYEIIKEHRDWYWFFDNGRYNYRAIEREELVREGVVAVGAGAPAELRLGQLGAGRYRVEVADAGGGGGSRGGSGSSAGAGAGVATSLRFSAGWWVEPQGAETPDMAQVTSERPAYAPGETARVHIAPPFAGEALVAVATDRIHAVQSVSVPAGGATVEVPVSAEWGPGAYVMAWVYRPPVAGGDRLPVRALGITWLGVDSTSRRLAVEIEAPERVRPRGQSVVTVRVRPAAGGGGGGSAGAPLTEPAYVTLAAVDEGILQLTRFPSPDPAGHYFGKRALGLDLRDDYGRLIDPLEGPAGPLRSGGDIGGGALPVVPITVASLFSGPLLVDADGSVRVPLDIPDFDGELRLMAVAWSHGAVGSAARPLTVRDPVVAQVTLPRFLAPGDQSQVTVSVHAVDGPPGMYRIAVTGEGAVMPAAAGGPPGVGGGTLPGAGAGPGPGGTGFGTGTIERSETPLVMARGDRRTVVVPVRAGAVGLGAVTVALSGPDRIEVVHRLPIAVRSARPPVTMFEARQLAPGETVAAEPAALSAYTPGSAKLAWSFSSAPPMDVAGLLQALHRYPYGCLEQVTSRGMPLLFVSELAAALGRDPGERVGADRGGESGVDAKARVQDAIARVLDKQRYDGAFGLWSARDEAEPWLTAYATDFLTRARERGFAVPDAPYRAALTWLRELAVDGPTDSPDLAARAYALQVLALSGVLTPGPARYFHDAFKDKLPTPLARGQVAAALARLGDRGRAQPMAAAALDGLKRDPGGFDYGSTVRDAAALVTVLGEEGLLDGAATAALVDRLPGPETRVAVTSTQEQAWLTAAASVLMKGAGRLKLQVSGGGAGGVGTGVAGAPGAAGQAVSIDPYQIMVAGPGAAGGGLRVRNGGSGAVWYASSLSGVPTAPTAAAREGLRIKRQFLTREGTPLNLDTVRQSDVFVMVLEGDASTGVNHQALVVHPLPGGWELENSKLGAGGTKNLAWLGTPTVPRAVELRDDRYVAAVDLTPASPGFRLAFLVRAVTPGTYELPGAQVEDMYKPRFFARQAVGRITVLPAGGN